MIHYTCDACGRYVDRSANRTRLRWKNITVDLMVAVDGTWNAGHVCLPCIVRTLNEGREVPS